MVNSDIIVNSDTLASMTGSDADARGEAGMDATPDPSKDARGEAGMDARVLRMKKPERKNQKETNPQTPTGAESEIPDLLFGDDEPTPVKKSKAKTPNQPDRFDEFWDVVPKKAGKGQARKSWKAALKKTTAEILIEGVKAYAKICQSKNTDPRYIKHPSTWLNGECWEDETILKSSKSVAEPEITEGMRKYEDDWERMQETFQNQNMAPAYGE